MRHLSAPAVWNVARGRYASTVRAIAARADDEVAGLALALPGPDGQFELLSLYVAPLFRRMGHGSALMQAVENDFRTLGYRLGVHFFTLGECDAGPAAFLSSCGWSRPVASKLVCRATVAKALRTRWITESRLPSPYRIVDWCSLTATQRTSIEIPAGQRRDAEIDPFLHEEGRDDPTSIAMIDATDGRPLGWTITHRLDDRTLRWTCSFLAPEFQVTTLVVAMWLEVARRSRDAGLEDFTFTISLRQARMSRFVLRHIWPLLSMRAYACTTVKEILR